MISMHPYFIIMICKHHPCLSVLKKLDVDGDWNLPERHQIRHDPTWSRGSVLGFAAEGPGFNPLLHQIFCVRLILLEFRASIDWIWENNLLKWWFVKICHILKRHESQWAVESHMKADETDHCGKMLCKNRKLEPLCHFESIPSNHC